MTDPLVAFLKVRLDEDERVALQCIDEVGPERAGEPFTDGSGIADRDSFPSYPWGSQRRELEFMAGPGHPARVLAEVAAKRQLVELHVPQLYSRPYRQLPTFTGCSYCAWGPVFPCLTMRLLALPYAGHPEYWDGWAPDVDQAHA